jgi:hypothetical protein
MAQSITDNRADYYNFLTKTGSTQLLLSLPQWTKITMRLNTAGPVVVGTREQLDPVISGKGAPLVTDQEFEMLIGPNTRVYYFATGINSVTIKVEAIPWMLTIASLISDVVKAISGLKLSAPAPSGPSPQRRC